MNWASASDIIASFFYMGGYAFYVWGSYGVMAGLIVVEINFLRIRRRAALEQLGYRGMEGKA